MQSKDWNLIEIPWTWDIYLNSDLLSFSSQTWRNPGREIHMWIENKIVKRQKFKDYIGNTKIFQSVATSILFEYSFPGERKVF